MGLSVGIVGLPNVGKSTLFNALLKKSISPEGNYAFTTVKPFTGIVAVPDDKLDALCTLLKPARCKTTTITVIDIAGLVKNAHKGEGLGNEFIGKIREVDLIIHVVRTFEDENVTHIMGSVDPDRDREVIIHELEQSGLHKPMIEWVNSSIDDFEKLDMLIKKAYSKLGLITFYTVKGGEEIRAVALKKGGSAIEAASQVHSDFAKKFIKAEVISAQKLLSLGSWKKAKEKGNIKLEGKDYIVRGGDVIEFKIGS